MSKQEYAAEFATEPEIPVGLTPNQVKLYKRLKGEDDKQQMPTTDLDNDPEINSSTTAGEPNEGVEEEDETEDGEEEEEGASETSKQLAATLRRLTNGTFQRSTRSLDQLHISERKATEAAKPEPTRANDTADELVAAMQRVREAKR